jgi:hypothetical protein
VKKHKAILGKETKTGNPRLYPPSKPHGVLKRGRRRRALLFVASEEPQVQYTNQSGIVSSLRAAHADISPNQAYR